MYYFTVLALLTACSTASCIAWAVYCCNCATADGVVVDPHYIQVQPSDPSVVPVEDIPALEYAKEK